MNLWICYYQESHRDKFVTFLGIFTTEELAEEARDEHMESEARRGVRRIYDYNYTIQEHVVVGANTKEFAKYLVCEAETFGFDVEHDNEDQVVLYTNLRRSDFNGT